MEEGEQVPHINPHNNDDPQMLAMTCARCLGGIKACQDIISDLHVTMARHVRQGSPGALALWHDMTW